MKGTAEIILGILVMVLAAVCVWEYTIISSQKKAIKSKQLMIDAQAVRARNMQEEIVERDKTIKMLTSPADVAQPQTVDSHAEE